ncbi:D-sedoheptulose 7-phosphate isomerase [Methylobacillus flagellatus]|uniref:D-sedoheptulose 7-phosphate isomerase n=1 Tax=Methylobacillus flagellatus TaxID=405 RepID=UPI002853ED8C|nr:D-sedoheptulose 7-phosphate isomerase [Methylobacillus flagellatus]MDR5170857.1 D-sedoheptulose 7-phosphate isomerase [Methylobacillus flagellatus]
MNAVDTLKQAFSEHQAVIAALEPLLPKIADVAQAMRACLANGGKILLFGNGGSAADSQHIAAEIVGRYKKERRGLPAIALTTDTSILTSVGNDYGFDFIFSRQVEALCLPVDLVIGFSTSGNSRNVVLGIEKAREIGAVTVAMTGGSGGKLASLCDHVLIMPTSDTPRIQEAHILIGHSLCDLVEAD